MRRALKTVPVLILALTASGCGDSAQDVGLPAPDPATLPGMFAGTFPCQNCPGIETTLWLRNDNTFFLAQHFPGNSAVGEATSVAHALGRWSWQPDERVLTLAGSGPPRRFDRPSADDLLMRTASSLEYRLSRNARGATFDETIRVEGMVRARDRARDDGYTFRECLTGYEVPLETGGDYARFTRQFRRVVPTGTAAPALFDARFAWAANGSPASIRVERFVTLRTGPGC